MPVKKSTMLRAYPELGYGGYTRCDGTVAFFARVSALLAPDDHVLDIGCGRGASFDDASSPWRNSLRNFKGRAAKVTGIDVDEEAGSNPSLDAFHLIEDHRTWPVEDESIDLAVSSYVLEHVEDPARFFSECHRVLKPGGHLCLQTPNRYSYVSMAASLIPNRFHAGVTAKVQDSRRSDDVFPTYYRCNTKRSILRTMRRAGFDVTVLRHEAEPAYLRFSSIAYRLGVLVHRLMPPPLASTLLIYARKT